MERLIGRKKEQEVLNKIVSSPDAEFLAIYGRRRVGKTFLVREFFKHEDFYFEAIGEKDGSMHEQLLNFHDSIQKAFSPGIPLKQPDTWKEAFSILTTLIEKLKIRKKIILFFDELPWMATKRSGFIQALDHYWNKTWSRISNLKLIVCGSAASWVLDNLIHAKGGLYNRLTGAIHLVPFSLKETKEYLLSRKINLKNDQILDIYMVFGGIPFYLHYIDKGKSPAQIINSLCFSRDAPFFTEFNQLFKSLFEHSEVHVRLIREIARKRFGISREELLKALGMSSGGTFKKRLDELEASSFIEIFTPYGRSKKDFYIKIIDEYTLFYLHFIDAVKQSRTIGKNKNYWLSVSKEPAFKIWSGYAFEAVCLKHIDKIIRALGLENLAKQIGSWRFVPQKGSLQSGAQIDLLIDRLDNAITLCEIKYAGSMYTIDKQYANNLKNKITVFENQTKTRKQLFLAAITTHGIKRNVWSEDLITSEVTLSDLFL
ncbi:MAG: AAA family ATPase [bacterium]